MAFDLATVQHKTIDYKKKDITAFTPNLTNGELYIAYNLLDENGTIVSDDLLTVEPVDFQNMLTKISTDSGIDIYSILKKGLYDELERQTGEAGTIE